MIIWDVLAFLAVIRQVWGLWREKRRLHLHTNADVVSLLFQQEILRFSLSIILTCEFTLGLRRRNTENAIINQSALELPNISFRENPAQSIQSVLGRLHENIISEMGERNDSATVNNPGQEVEEKNREAA
ncbi:hypothetical protein Clacol_004321 [Clathrus columnatus]|uniref:Uncharacterized protein n=1 Tax=Clathrus columnatus TaxID=1419009 RepID=A0AAV5A737_9AGAM|nr:hypothetical protein Clacol_004321 [Clathrus columnatus]